MKSVTILALSITLASVSVHHVQAQETRNRVKERVGKKTDGDFNRESLADELGVPSTTRHLVWNGLDTTPKKQERKRRTSRKAAKKTSK